MRNTCTLLERQTKNEATSLVFSKSQLLRKRILKCHVAFEKLYVLWSGH